MPVQILQPTSQPFQETNGGTPFTESQNAPYAIVGFKVRSGIYIDAVTPIYGQLLDNGTIGQQITGSQHGGNGGTEQIVRPGNNYVVTGLIINQGSYTDGFKIIFQKWTSQGLNISDQLITDHLGGNGGGAPFTLSGPPGTVAVGICGRSGAYVDRISLTTGLPILQPTLLG